MADAKAQPVTLILQRAERGDARAAAELLPLVYAELRELAAARMAREHVGHTLQATALVHDAYVRLVGDDNGGGPQWANRAHFFAAAAEAMRRILIETARAKGRQKRGGDGARRVPLQSLNLAADENSEEILAVDEALRRLEKVAADVAAVVRLRFFAGLSVEQTALALGVSERSVYRDWTYARAWLARELGDEA